MDEITLASVGVIGIIGALCIIGIAGSALTINYIFTDYTITYTPDTEYIVYKNGTNITEEYNNDPSHKENIKMKLATTIGFIIFIAGVFSSLFYSDSFRESRMWKLIKEEE